VNYGKNKYLICIVLAILIMNVSISISSENSNKSIQIKNQLLLPIKMDINKKIINISSINLKNITINNFTNCCKNNNVMKISEYHKDDYRITNFNDNAQNPSIISDGDRNLFCIYERDLSLIEENIIGVSFSNSNGITWSNEDYFFMVPNAVQPRQDFYTGKTIYGTWIINSSEDNNGFWLEEIQDMTDISTGGASYKPTSSVGIDHILSSDIACYHSEQSFWWILAVAFTNDYKDYSKFAVFFNEGEDKVSGFMFESLFKNVFNISIDIDQSNGWAFIAHDSISKDNPSEKGVGILFANISSDLQNAPWIGLTYDGFSNPNVEACDGRIYITSEYEDDKDPDRNVDSITCISTMNPMNYRSWVAYYVTSELLDNVKNPIISAKDNNNATIIFTSNSNLYYSRTHDGGRSWSSETRVNQNDGSVVEQYGCSDICGEYVVWTDNRNDGKDIYFNSLTDIPSGEIEISSISGGIGVTAIVSNIGDAEITDVDWIIDLKGDHVFNGNHYIGTLPSIAPGEKAEIKTIASFGFGFIDVVVNVNDVVITKSGSIFGPFVFGLNEINK